MDKKIKDYIADKKLSDEDIYKLLTAEPILAGQEEKEQNVEEDADGEQESDVEEDATKEQPDIGELIKVAVAEQLAAMKKGKKPPKSKIKEKKAPIVPIWKEFGSIK